MKISAINAREILDSRGQPTVEAEVILDGGVQAIAMVPSGASTGSREAIELRDGDAARFSGKGVKKAVSHILHDIAPRIVGLSADEQRSIDNTLLEIDGTENKSKLGANAMLAVSLAVAKVAALSQKKPLHETLGWSGPFLMPIPLVNVINGGAHANNHLSIQEFMIVPLVSELFSEKIRAASEVFMALKSLLQKDGMSTAVGDEGGFAPEFRSSFAALDYLMQAIELAGYVPGQDIALALDVASSELYRESLYHFSELDTPLASDKVVDFYTNMVSQYPIVSIEDGCAEDDWQGWQMLTEHLGKKCQLVGDDLFVTQSQYLKKGFEQQVANAILIKPNQVGTISETFDAIKLAQQNNYGVVLSHRSGETEDSMLADLAVGTQAGQIKTGSVCRSERIAKYNQLLRIESNHPDSVKCHNTILNKYLDR